MKRNKKQQSDQDRYFAGKRVETVTIPKFARDSMLSRNKALNADNDTLTESNSALLAAGFDQSVRSARLVSAVKLAVSTTNDGVLRAHLLDAMVAYESATTSTDNVAEEGHTA